LNNSGRQRRSRLNQNGNKLRLLRRHAMTCLGAQTSAQLAMKGQTNELCLTQGEQSCEKD
jgi:hypothetical protein